jgi:hypothetical protein
VGEKLDVSLESGQDCEGLWAMFRVMHARLPCFGVSFTGKKLMQKTSNGLTAGKSVSVSLLGLAPVLALRGLVSYYISKRAPFFSHNAPNTRTKTFASIHIVQTESAYSWAFG